MNHYIRPTLASRPLCFPRLTPRHGDGVLVSSCAVDFNAEVNHFSDALSRQSGVCALMACGSVDDRPSKRSACSSLFVCE